MDAYRRARSPFGVKEHVVPLLAEAEPVPSTFVTLIDAIGGGAEEHPSLLA